MTALLEADIYTGPTPGTRALATGGVSYGRDDTVHSGSEMPEPLTQGTVFSFPKTFALFVTQANALTHIRNRRIFGAFAPPAGIHIWFQVVASYAQATAPADVDNPDNGAAPTGYSEMPLTSTLYDGSIIPSTVGQRNGAFVRIAAGLDPLFTPGVGIWDLPAFTLSWDETP